MRRTGRSNPRERSGDAVGIKAMAPLHNVDHQDGSCLRTGLASVAGGLWDAAGIAPSEVDVACVYDDYPVMVLVQLADLGFFAQERVHRYVHEQIATRRLALNTSGGHRRQPARPGRGHGAVAGARRRAPGRQGSPCSGHGLRHGGVLPRHVRDRPGPRRRPAVSFTVDQCRRCLHAVHPARYLCPDCHGSDWQPIPAHCGILRQFTRLPDPRGGDACLGTLQTDPPTDGHRSRRGHGPRHGSALCAAAGG